MVRNIAVTMAVGATLCGTICNGGMALAMPFGNLAAASERAIQRVDYLCGPSYGCWTQQNSFYGPFYGPVTGPVAVAPVVVPNGYAIRWQGPPPYGRLWYGRSPYDPGWYTGGWRW